MKFKKIFLVGLVSALAVTNVCAATATVQVGTTKSQIQTEVKNNRTLVPLRQVATLMGLSVDYNQAAKSITLTREGQVVVLKLDNAAITINGMLYKIDSAPVAINNSTYLPLRVIAEAFGHSIGVNQGVFTVTSIEDAKKVLAATDEVKITRTDNKGYSGFEDNINLLVYAWHELSDEEEHEEYMRLMGEAVFLYLDAEKVIDDAEKNGYKLTTTLSEELSRINRAITINTNMRNAIVATKTEYSSINSLLNKASDSFQKAVVYTQKIQSSYYYRDNMVESFNAGCDYYDEAMEAIYDLTEKIIYTE